jgi:hypothetical protein
MTVPPRVGAGVALDGGNGFVGDSPQPAYAKATAVRKNARNP